MNTFKAITASILLALSGACPAFAASEPTDNSNNATATTAASGVVETVMYTSKATGLIVEVPADAKLSADNMKDGVLFTTADQLYVFAAVPFDTAKDPKDALSDEYIKFSKSARVDLSNSVYFKGKNDTVGYEGDMANHPNGSCSIVSMVASRTTSRGFFVTIVAGPEYVQSIHSTLRTIAFNSSAIK